MCVVSLGCVQPQRVIVVREKDYEAAKREEAASKTRSDLSTNKTYQELMEGVRHPK
jgi:hypothetical protein